MRNDRSRNIGRQGIARISLLVTLGVVCLLGTLLAAGILRAREDSRRLQCLGRIKMIGLAIQHYATVHQEPPPLTCVLAANGDGQFIGPWLLPLLPALDEAKLWRRIQSNVVLKSGEDEEERYLVDESDKITLGYLLCPDVAVRPAGLSYVVNTGFIARELYQADPNRKHKLGNLRWTAGLSGEDGVHRATGIFWHGDSISIDDISMGDGATATLMLTENLQAGNWYDTNTARIGFGFPVVNLDGQVPLGSGHVFESPAKALNTEFQGGTLKTAKPQDWRINADRKATIGTLPRPSSNHGGTVSVMMCDGSGRFLNENIDPHVYLKLLTSNGVKYGERELKQSNGE